MLTTEKLADGVMVGEPKTADNVAFGLVIVMLCVEDVLPAVSCPKLIEVGEAGGVEVLTAATRAAFRIPAPQVEVVQVLPTGKLVTVACNTARACVVVMDEILALSSATAAETCGAAMEVPW